MVLPLVLAVAVYIFGGTKADAIVYSGPINITSGGTYTGNWESTNPSTPAVKISTTQPVIIENSNIRSRGDLILGSSRVNLTVRNTRGYGLNPNTKGWPPGQFIATDGGFVNLVVENNYFENSAGIWAYDYRGNRTSSQTLKVVRNQARNLDGRQSDGNGGWIVDDIEEQEATQFLQLDNVPDVPYMEIGWNEIVNLPWESRVEDNINFFRSGGTPTSRTQIHHNYVQGAYPALPESQEFAGGGILVGDTTEESPAGGYIDIYSNIVVSTTNYGISVVCGRDVKVWDNRIISSGKLPDGRNIYAMNVGLSMGSAASWGWPCDAYVNNTATGNVLGWQDGSSRNDSWTPHCANCSGNTNLPSPITLATEQAEYTRWQNMVAENNIKLGPQDRSDEEPEPKQGDVNDDGSVNGTDLNLVLRNYGRSGMQRSDGDLDANGAVNALDLSLVLAHYGN